METRQTYGLLAASTLDYGTAVAVLSAGECEL